MCEICCEFSIFQWNNVSSQWVYTSSVSVSPTSDFWYRRHSRSNHWHCDCPITVTVVCSVLLIIVHIVHLHGLWTVVKCYLSCTDNNSCDWLALFWIAFLLSSGLRLQHPDLNSLNYKICIKLQQRVFLSQKISQQYPTLAPSETSTFITKIH